MTTSSYSYSTAQYPSMQLGNVIQVGNTTQTGNTLQYGDYALSGGITMDTGKINNNYCCQMTSNTEFSATNAFTKITGLSPGGGGGFTNSLLNMGDQINSQLSIPVAGVYLIHARINAPDDGITLAALTVNDDFGNPMTFKYHNANSLNSDQIIEMTIMRYFAIGQTIQIYIANSNFANIGGSSDVLTTYLSGVLLN